MAGGRSSKTSASARRSARDAADAARRRRLRFIRRFTGRFAPQSARHSPARSAIPPVRSTTCSPSMSCSARRWPTSRLTRYCESRLRRRSIPEARLSRRHLDGGFAGDRRQGEFQPGKRRRLCAVARRQPARGRETAIDYAPGDGQKRRRAAAPEAHVPKLPDAVGGDDLGAACPRIDRAAFDVALSGSSRRFEDYSVGEASTMSTGSPSRRPST